MNFQFIVADVPISTTDANELYSSPIAIQILWPAALKVESYFNHRR